MQKKKKAIAETSEDSFVVLDETALANFKPEEFFIHPMDGYDIPDANNIIKIPVQISVKTSIPPGGNVINVPLAIKEFNIPSQYRLRLNVAKSFSERGIILLEEYPFITKDTKNITIGHMGKQIVEIKDKDFLFVAWLENNITLE